MNLLLIGGALLGAAAFDPEPGAPKAPMETAADTTLSAPAGQQPWQKPAPKAEPARKTSEAAPGETPDRGWMTRDTIVDQKTGETTEVSVIGFAD